ncbi:MAG: PKD domain-containing protein [bacterium]
MALTARFVGILLMLVIAAGCNGSGPDPVPVPPDIPHQVTVDPITLEGVADRPHQFRVSAEGTVTHWLWNFGTMSEIPASSEKEPWVRLRSAGRYTGTVELCSDEGCAEPVSFTVNVIDERQDPPPVPRWASYPIGTLPNRAPAPKVTLIDGRPLLACNLYNLHAERIYRAAVPLPSRTADWTTYDLALTYPAFPASVATSEGQLHLFAPDYEHGLLCKALDTELASLDSWQITTLNGPVAASRYLAAPGGRLTLWSEGAFARALVNEPQSDDDWDLVAIPRFRILDTTERDGRLIGLAAFPSTTNEFAESAVGIFRARIADPVRASDWLTYPFLATPDANAISGAFALQGATLRAVVGIRYLCEMDAACGELYLSSALTSEPSNGADWHTTLLGAAPVTIGGIIPVADRFIICGANRMAASTGDGFLARSYAFPDTIDDFQLTAVDDMPVDWLVGTQIDGRLLIFDHPTAITGPTDLRCHVADHPW